MNVVTFPPKIRVVIPPDSIVHATAVHVNGVIRTQDDGFDGLDDVHFFVRKTSTR